MSDQTDMATDHPASGSILWVGKAPVNGGGDEIYDRKVLAHLSGDHAVAKFDMALQPRLNQLHGVLRGLPHPCFKTANPAVERAFAQAVARHSNVVISHEANEHLARMTQAPLTLVLHNVTHDVLTQLYGANLIGRLAAAQSLRWDRRLYARENIRLVTLSRRDQALVEALAPARPVAIASPGLPPLAPLRGHAIIPEIVLSGSYEWRPKRRDLIALAGDVAASGHAFAWRHDLPLPGHPEVAHISNAARPIEIGEYCEGLRFGLIPDRFLGGFKLKSTYFIANNCILLSRCDIRSEFDGLPHAALFVRFTPNVSDIPPILDEFARMDADDIRDRFVEFQQACARQFSWDKAAHVIAATFE